jgi:hypothetical protein
MLCFITAPTWRFFALASLYYIVCHLLTPRVNSKGKVVM